MTNVNELLASKGFGVHSIGSTRTVREAIAKMVSRNVGSLVVLENRKPCGIITERDYLRRVALEGRSSESTFVREIMSTELVYVDLYASIDECMSLMTRRRIRHLPVLRDTRLIGMLSIGDIVKHMAQETREEIEEMIAYIQGRY